MKRFDKHIFVCENKRPEGHPRGCCHEKNSVNLREELKAKIKGAGLSSTVRVNSAGCLDACEFGPVMVVYPEQTWYGNFNQADLDQIIREHIIDGKVVERLTIKDPKYNR